MYYPYLRARQFELITLRELAPQNKINAEIFPILEPVKESFANLTLAHKTFVENSFFSFLIVNPIVGEMKGDSEHFLKYMSSIENLHFKAAFHYYDNKDYILDCIDKFELNDCLLICYENFSNENDFKDLCKLECVTHIMMFEPHKNRSLDRFVKGLHKNYIRLDDLFQKQSKNADFLEINAHKFSEEHLFFNQDGYQGFSDFTVLPSEYIDGGSTPRAVVIHISYLNEECSNEIWVRHFTSNSNDSISNVQGKFAEAVEKAIIFCEKNKFSNSAILELKEYYIEKKYPGLGIVKKISIKNHLLVVKDFLMKEYV